MKKHLPTVLLLAALAACSSRTDEQMLQSAKQRMEAKDPTGASIELKNLLQKNPDNAQARLMLGQALVEAGDMAGAEIELRRALDLGAPRDETLPPLAQALLSSGQGQKVIGEFADQTLTDPNAMATVQSYLAQAYLAERNLDQAKTAAAHALQLAPNLEAAELVSVRVKAASGLREDALAQVQGLLQKFPKSVKALMLQADLLASLGRGADVAAVLQAVLQIDPSHFEARGALLRDALVHQRMDEAQKLIDGMPAPMAKMPQGRFLQAEMALAKGDAGKARDLAQPLIKVMPSYLPLARLLAGAYQQLGQTADAESLLGQAIKALPDDVALRRQYAALELQNRAPALALEVLKPVLDSGKVDAETQMIVGKAEIMQGNFQAADEAFGAAAKQRPEDPKMQAGLALAALARDAAAPGGPAKAKADAAINQLRDLAAKDKGSNFDLMLVNALIRRQDLPAALTAIDKLAAKMPGSPIPATMRGRVELANKDLKGARAAFEAANKADAAYLPAMLGLVGVDRAEGKIDDGIKRLEDYIHNQAHAATARLALAETLATLPKSADRVNTVLSEGVRQEPTDPALRLALIDLRLRLGDTKGANQAAQEAVSVLPQNADVLERLARTQLLVGDKAQALKSYTELTSLAPARAFGYLGLAQLKVLEGDIAGGEREVKRALEAEPGSQMAQRLSIQFALRQGHVDEAINALHARQKEQPQEAFAYVAEADIDFSRKQFDPGLALLRKAVGLKDPGDAPARLFAALLAAGKPDEAKVFEVQWMSTHGLDRGFPAATADILLSRGDLEGALARYEALLKRNPDVVSVINNVAWLRSRTGKPGAVEMAERGLKLDPDNQALRDTYATVLSDAKQYGKAINLQRQLVSDYPDNSAYKLNLAQILLASGDKAAAKKELEELAKLGSKFPQQRLVEELLKKV